MSVDSGWNISALFGPFLCGLYGIFKAQLIYMHLPTKLDELVALAVKIDDCLWKERRASSCPPNQLKTHLLWYGPGVYFQQILQNIYVSFQPQYIYRAP